ncbi:MAG: FHA domain-containing protein [Pseudomonadota bacterium]
MQPFRVSGGPLTVSSYAGHRKALEFLATTVKHRHGLGMLQGPLLSGKSTVVHQFLAGRGNDVSTAIIDGSQATRVSMLKDVLDQFGYPLDLETPNEVLNMLRVFAMQQTVAGQAPIMVIENCQDLSNDVMRTLCELADLRTNRQSALRIFMTCERSIEHMFSAPDLKGIASRLTGVHRLRSMTPTETQDYLYEKLYAAGADDPKTLMPAPVCKLIFDASGGWPGVVDRLADFALTKAEKLPITEDLIEIEELPEDMQAQVALTSVASGSAKDNADPKLMLSRHGEFLAEIPITQARIMIGRSPHNDVAIDSKFASRHHALLVCNGSSTLLMDLNSTNGTFVNSRRISNHVLRHDDIISLGSFRLKFVHATADRHFKLDDSGFTETVIMKSLEDMRHMLAGESTQTLPIEAMDKLVAGDND